jgi:hypothetical protein
LRAARQARLGPRDNARCHRSLQRTCTGNSKNKPKENKATISPASQNAMSQRAYRASAIPTALHYTYATKTQLRIPKHTLSRTNGVGRSRSSTSCGATQLTHPLNLAHCQTTQKSHGEQEQDGERAGLPELATSQIWRLRVTTSEKTSQNCELVNARQGMTARTQQARDGVHAEPVAAAASKMHNHRGGRGGGELHAVRLFCVALFRLPGHSKQSLTRSNRKADNHASNQVCNQTSSTHETRRQEQ